jgi:hypothetical protein
VMHDHEKSDPAIVARKPTNAAGRPAAEPVERRAGTEGNADQRRTRLTSTEVVEIRGARRRAGATITSLAQARRRLASEVVIGPLG